MLNQSNAGFKGGSRGRGPDVVLMAEGEAPIQAQTEVSEATEEEAQAQSGGMLPPEVTEETTTSSRRTSTRTTTQNRAARGQQYMQWRQEKESEFERLERIVADEPRDSVATKIGRY